MPKEIVVSGIRPTGDLHLGNYFGAIRNYVRMQDEYDCFFFIADYHSLTTHPDPKDLKRNAFHAVAENIAAGLDPNKATLYLQSDVPQITELYLMLTMLAYKGELEKVPTFKDKVRNQPSNVNAGLLTYPVLMAADIMIHRATKVPVGKDQAQHIEMARNFAKRFSQRYGDLFPEPYPFNYGDNLVKVPSLDGVGKMSKSENQNATLFLSDADETIRRKVMKATTGSAPIEHNSIKPEPIQNLFALMKLVTNVETLETYEQSWNNCTIRFGDLKNQLSEDMVTYIRPIREHAATLLEDEDRLKKILKDGGTRARKSARTTLKKARSLMGLKYY